MKNTTRIAIFLFAAFISAGSSIAQSDDQNWKVLIANNNKKIWYDAASLDTVKGSEFTIWALELHKPPLDITGIKEPIYKSKTLYKINLELLRYGISQIVYYNSSDKQIAKYNYDLPGKEDNFQYSYPVLDSPVLTGIIKNYIKNKELKLN